MMRSRKSRALLFLVIMICSITVGYAILSVSFKINGLASITSSNWILYFDNLNITNGSVPTIDGGRVPTIPTGSKSTNILEWDVNFDKPGQFYEFTVDIVNDGSIDAEIESIDMQPELDTDMAKLVEYSVTYEADDSNVAEGDGILAGDYRTIKVLVTFKKDIEANDLNLIPDGGIDLNLSIEINYLQSNGPFDYFSNPYVIDGLNTNSEYSESMINFSGKSTKIYTSIVNNYLYIYGESLIDFKFVKLYIAVDGLELNYKIDRLKLSGYKDNIETDLIRKDLHYSVSNNSFEYKIPIKNINLTSLNNIELIRVIYYDSDWNSIIYVYLDNKFEIDGFKNDWSADYIISENGSDKLYYYKDDTTNNFHFFIDVNGYSFKYYALNLFSNGKRVAKVENETLYLRLEDDSGWSATSYKVYRNIGDGIEIVGDFANLNIKPTDVSLYQLNLIDSNWNTVKTINFS